MTKPINDETANQNISPAFRPVFSLIKDKYIQQSENIFVVCCCTYMSIYYRNDSIDVMRISAQPSLLVISEHRWIRAEPRFLGNCKEATYKKIGSWLARIFGRDYLEWKWVDISHLKNLSKNIDIIEVPLSKLQIIRRLDYKVEFEGDLLNLVEIQIDNNSWVAFRESDGNKVYSVMQEAAKNNGRIQVVQENIVFDAPIESLKKIKELLDLGLINEKEYELKKQEILARL